MFWAALGQALPLAVGIAVSPIPIILVILVMVSPRPRAGGVVFAAGWTVGVFAVASVRKPVVSVRAQDRFRWPGTR